MCVCVLSRLGRDGGGDGDGGGGGVARGTGYSTMNS